MKNLQRTLLLVGAATALIAAPVLAGQAGRPGRLDANQDHQISLQEMQAQAQQRFQAADSNHDGQLSADERSQQHAGCKGRHKGQKQGQKQSLGPDANGDGQISQAESQAAVQKRFERLDVNHDGRISSDELKARRGKRPKRQQREVI